MKIEINYKHLLKINFFAFVCYALFFFLSEYFSLLFFLKVLFGIFVMLISGVNIVTLLKIFIKKEFDFWEIICLSFLSLMFIFPLIITLEFVAFKKIYYSLPFINFLAILILLCLIIGVRKIKLHASLIFIKKIGIKEIFLSPLFIAFSINAIIVFIIFSAFPFLPDKDPFKWLFKLSDLFASNSLSSLTSRPFFSGIVYIFIKITGIEIVTFFKYFIPILSLAIILPIYLVARNMKNKLNQLLLLLTPLITSNIILYSQTAMPQVFFVFMAYFFVFFLLKCYQDGDLFYYYLAGVVCFFAIFFHEAAAIIFLTWLVITAYFYRKRILLNKREFFYIIIIIISNATLLKIDFISFWVKRIIQRLAISKINLLFPAYYKNIDGNEMGWATPLGVLKFYTYYIGPFLFFLFFLLIYFLIRKYDFRKYFFKKIKNKEIFILLTCFFIFFAISELFPRFLNLAMLPDRSWVFGGIFSIVFLYLLIDYFEENGYNLKRFYFFSLLFLAVTSFGALYINNQKRFFITENELSSAKWIRENIPTGSTFMTASSKAIIEYYSNSKMILVPANFYSDENSVINLKNKNDTTLLNDLDFTQYYETVKSSVDKMNYFFSNYKEGVREEEERIKLFMAINRDNNVAFKNLFSKISISKKNKNTTWNNLYIYYSEKSRNNPYAGRPYEMKEHPMVDDFVFDKYPEKFHKIYEKNGDGRVIIWKVL